MSVIVITAIIIVYIIIIIIIIIIINEIYTQYLQLYTWKTHVSRVRSVAAILYLEFKVHANVICHGTRYVLLTLVHCEVCVQCPNMPVACSSSTLYFPSMMFRYFLNDFDMVPVGPIISGIAFVFT